MLLLMAISLLVEITGFILRKRKRLPFTPWKGALGPVDTYRSHSKIDAIATMAK